MTWDVTNDIQSFVKGQYSNYGWKVLDENYWGMYNIPIMYFYSKEASQYNPYLKI